MVEAIYHNCKSVVQKTLPAVPVDIFYRTLIISFLTVLPLEPLCNSILALMSVPWHVAKLFGLCEVHSLLIPRKGLGSTTPLNQADSRIKTMRYALLVIGDN